MVDYPLEELSPRAFEQLTVALALKVLGPGVSAFGSGPDGGREATYDGPINWSATTGLGTDSWNGYTIIQAKQRERLGDPNNNAVWLRQEIDKELKRWMSPTSKRGAYPEYIIFVTNVNLSSVAGAGGIDALDTFFKKRLDEHDEETDSTLRGRGLRGWRIWHRDQLHGLLTGNSSVRNAFPAMLTAGDILARMADVPTLADHADALNDVLVDHAMTTLSSERWVNFDEAGGSNHKAVDDVIIDVRATGGSPGLEDTILGEVLTRGDQVLRKSIWNSDAPRHLVLTGQPGNGKSTLSRFLIQAYRAKFLQDEERTPPAQDAMAGTERALTRLSRRAPSNRRWPLRIDLTRVADDLGPTSDKSLLRWLSELVSKRSEIDITPRLLRRWLHSWPSILVFDGLDEVTVPEVRRNILDEIRSLVHEADHKDADLFVIITTRPTGYTERFEPSNFEQVDLHYLSLEEALAYGSLVTRQRLAKDLDRQETVLTRFHKQADSPATARLMKTPLQVLIMTIILEKLGNLPADRYQLFWRYYETIYDREQGKGGPLAGMLSEHKGAITEIHERVGLVLQQHAETAGDARALLPKQELRELTEQRLRELGYDEGTRIEHTAAQIVQAATHRLVLLVPAEDNSIAFEIRSLQELMAARALSSGPDDVVTKRLLATSASPHWRNTWVFAAGRLFADGPDHRRDLVVQAIDNADRRREWPSWLCPIGPELAADLLEDGLAVAKPRWQRQLLTIALQGLSRIPRDVGSLARGLTSAADDPNSRIRIRSEVRSHLAGTPMQQRLAHNVARSRLFTSTFPGFIQLPSLGPDMDSGPIFVTTLLAAGLETVEMTPKARDLVEDLLEELRNLSYKTRRSGIMISASPSDSLPRSEMALRDPEASDALELLAIDLGPEQWHATWALAYKMWPVLSRQPVGPLLTPG